MPATGSRPSASNPAACPTSSRSGSGAHRMSVSPQSNRTASSTGGYATRALLRRTLWALLALAPVTIGVNYLTDAGDTALFVLACAALVPLAWLIGEATEHAAEHTGAGIGGFLNASFGNAPELIIALVAVSSNLPQVLRGSLAGSVISNLLLVLGVAQLVGPDGAEIDRRSPLTQLGLSATAIVLVLPVVVLGYTGDPERDAAVIA